MEETRQNRNKNGASGIGLLHGLYSLAIFAASAVFFFVGYKAGISTQAAPVSAPQLTVEAEESGSSYTVRSEKGKLCLYETDASGERLIASERISPEIFPAADREMLENGVVFTQRADAQALFEDFVN